MKKFTKVLENQKGSYIIEATIKLKVDTENEGEAGYLADSILVGVDNMEDYTIDNIEEEVGSLTENKTNEK
jgi:hypothetical protein